MNRLFKTKLFTTSMLVAPTIFMLGAAQPAQASCVVTNGGGTVADPANGAEIRCFESGGPRTTPVGNGTDGVSAIVELLPGAVVSVGTNTPVINIDNVTVNLGANSRISGTATGPGPGKYNTAVFSSTTGAANSTARVTLSGDNSQITTNKYGPNAIRSEANGTGNAAAVVTLSGDNSVISASGGVLNNANAIAVQANSGNASSVVTLSGDSAQINAKYSALSSRSTSGNAYTNVMLSGDGSFLSSNNTTVDTRAGGGVGQSATGIVTLSGNNANINSNSGRGIYVSGGDARALVTLGQNTSITSSSHAIQVVANQAGASSSIIDSAGLIQSGVGNSILLDDGNDSLILRTGSNLSSAAGADMGTGFDTVNLLGAGSENETFLNAEVLNMNGSAWTLSGTSTFSDVNVNSGRLAIDGTVTSNVNIESGGTLGGIGTIIGIVSNLGAVAPGNSIGTLNITGNYVQGPFAGMNVEFDPATIDLLAVTGTANIAGTAAFTQFSPGITNGTTLTFLQTTGGVTGLFSNVIHPLFIDVDLDYSNPNIVAATFNRIPLTTGAQTESELAVARELDALIAAGGPDADHIDQIVNTLPDADAASDFFASQGGLVEDGAIIAGLGSLEQGPDAAMDRLDQNVGVFASLTPEGMTGMSAGEQVKRRDGAVWANATGGFGDVDGDGNARGIDYETAGIAAGAELYADNHVTWGGFGAVSFTNAEPDGLRDEAEVNTYQLGLYAGMRSGPWSYQGTISGAWLDFETDRPTAAGNASADFSGSGWFSEITVAYGTPHKGWNFAPVGGLEGAALFHEDYSEHGAGILNLSVDSDDTYQLKSLIGVDVAHSPFEIARDRRAALMIQPDVRLLWAHEFLDTDSDSNINFASVPSVSFQTTGPERSRDAARVRAELLGYRADSRKVKFFTSYEGNLAADQQDHRATLGIKVKW